MPEISIIVPVYKAEQYLHSCVDSILGQTFSDFEVFLVDDGSPDNSGVLCEDYARRDPRVRVIHQENQGQSAARNHALQQAAGEWVCFVDSDDLIHPQLLELLYSAVQQSGTDMSICSGWADAQVPDAFLEPRKLHYSVVSMEDETLCDLFDRDEYPAWVAWGKLIRRSVVLEHPFCSGKIFEDNEAVCHWVCRAGKAAMLPYALYFYRTNPESTTQVNFSRKKLDYLWALEQIIRFYSSLGFSGMRARFARLYNGELINDCSRVSKYLEDRKLARSLYRRGRRFLKEQNLQMPPEVKEELMGVLHPKLMPLYWPVKGAVVTLRQDGAKGIVRKLKKFMDGGMSE